MIRYLKPMRARDPLQAHRTATPLELFFDLVFVVAIAISGGHFHHAVVSGHLGQGLVGFMMAFQCIWWAWMNFTWFSTAFDNDDWLFRVLTFVQMFGVLVLAVGSDAFYTGQHFAIPLLGFIIMRIALITQWLRASRCGGTAGAAAKRYAIGLGIAQLLWIVWVFLPPGLVLIGFFIFTAFELLVPIYAERTGRTNWHPHHITERYNLFTIIVLGESLLASGNAIADALQHREHMLSLLALALAAMTIAAGMWWLYFWPPHHQEIQGFARSLRYGYGHAFIFASAAAVSIGVEAQIGYINGESALGYLGTNLMMSVPVALFMLCVWAILLQRRVPKTISIAVPAAALIILALPIWGVAIVMAAVIVLLIREAEPQGHH